MVTVKKRFFHVRQGMKRFRTSWQKKIYDKMWRNWKRKKRIK